MVLEFNSSIRQYKKLFFKNYFLYTLLGFFILLNVLFFPDLLNNELIKLNDMSYLLPESSKVKHEKIIKIENSENKDQTVENTQIASDEKTEQVPVVSEKVNVLQKNNDAEIAEKNSDKDNKDKVANTNSDNFIGEKKQDIEPTKKEIPFKQETEEAIKKTNSSYLLIFTLILLALIISFGLFIYQNMETIKITFNSRKGYTNVREFINQGYELLQDE